MLFVEIGGLCVIWWVPYPWTTTVCVRSGHRGVQKSMLLRSRTRVLAVVRTRTHMRMVAGTRT